MWKTMGRGNGEEQGCQRCVDDEMESNPLTRNSPSAFYTVTLKTGDGSTNGL